MALEKEGIGLPEKKHLRVLWKIAVFALIILGIWLFFSYLFPLVSPFLLAILAAHLMEPAVRNLHEKLRLPRGVGAFLLTVLVIGAIASAIIWLGVLLVGELSSLSGRVSDWVSRIPELSAQWRDRLDFWIQAAPVSIQDFLYNSLDRIISEGFTIPQNMYATVAGWIGTAAGAVPRVMLFWVALILSTYFISRDYPAFSRWLMLRFSAGLRMKILQTKDHVIRTVGKWLKAQGLIMLLTFCEMLTGFLILGVDYAVLIAAIVAALDALPVIGIGLFLLPWGITSLLFGDKWFGLGMLVLYAVANLVRSFVEPRLVGKQLGLNPLVTLVAMYIGFRAVGILGMILFPIIAITLKQMYEWGWLDFFIPSRPAEPEDKKETNEPR